MHWDDHPQWGSFLEYNVGRWSGRALHIAAESGEYVEPYIRDYELTVVDDGQSGARELVKDIQGKGSEGMKQAGMTKPEDTLMNRITASDDFDGDEKGSYALDRWLVTTPDTGQTARLGVDVCVALSRDERVRCQVIYDKSSRLERVILREEYRMSDGGGNGENAAEKTSVRDPLNLLAYVGSYEGDAVSRRTWRLGGGWVRFKAKSTTLWDQTARIRREIEWVDGKSKTSKVTWGSIEDAYSNVADFETGDKLIFLPGGCWVCAPAVLIKTDGEPLPPFNMLDSLSLSSLEGSTGVSGGDTTDPSLDAFVSNKARGGGSGDTLASFSIEFGVYVAEEERIRIQRLYEEGGAVASTFTVREKLVG